MNGTTLFATRLLEAVAGFQFVVYCGMVIFFAWFIRRMIVAHRPPSVWAIWTLPSIKIGWALAVITLGEAINRGLVWWTRHEEINSGWVVWDSSFTVIATLAAVLSSWGALCAMRVASPAEYGERPWLIVMVIALVFAIVVSYGRVFL
jgi:hypothetical protein